MRPDDVILYGTRLSPFVEKVARVLALKKVEFRLVEPRTPLDFARWNPQTKKIPVVEVDGERIYDSTLICRRLQELVSEPPLFSADARAAAAQRQLEDWADESLYWYGMALRWTPKNAAATAAQIFAAVPAYLRPVAHLFGSRQIRAMTRAQGLGRLPEDVLVRELGRHLADLVVLLGDLPFFYADRPSVADLALYGQFHMLRSGPTPEAGALLDEQPPLLAHMRRVEAVTAEDL